VVNYIENKLNTMTEAKYQINNTADRYNMITALINAGYTVRVEEALEFGKDSGTIKTIYYIVIS